MGPVAPVQVKYGYELTVTEDELDALADMLGTC